MQIATFFRVAIERSINRTSFAGVESAGQSAGKNWACPEKGSSGSYILPGAGVDDELDRYAGHEVLRAILDQGCDPKEYGRHYEARLRQAELESIQDYLSESDNLVTLHQQV